jgi:acylphosphatase
MMRLHVIVRGVVQGVGFRFFTRDLAHRYRLGGFVRNMPDGTVEVEVQGEEGALSAFIEDLEIGPRSSHVKGIESREIPIDDAQENFEITF